MTDIRKQFEEDFYHQPSQRNIVREDIETVKWEECSLFNLRPSADQPSFPIFFRGCRWML